MVTGKLLTGHAAFDTLLQIAYAIAIVIIVVAGGYALYLGGKATKEL